MRAGRFLKQPGGYDAFVPNPLTPDPPVKKDREIDVLKAEARGALGRLDGISHIIPNTNLFIAMFMQKEAVLSSQIEGTRASLVDVLEFKAVGKAENERKKSDIREVLNYVDAMNYGLERLDAFPLSLRLIREMHERLLWGVRGASRNPGSFRQTQNHIGEPGSSIEDAV